MLFSFADRPCFLPGFSHTETHYFPSAEHLLLSFLFPFFSSSQTSSSSHPARSALFFAHMEAAFCPRLIFTIRPNTISRFYSHILMRSLELPTRHPKTQRRIETHSLYLFSFQLSSLSFTTPLSALFLSFSSCRVFSYPSIYMSISILVFLCNLFLGSWSRCFCQNAKRITCDSVVFSFTLPFDLFFFLHTSSLLRNRQDARGRVSCRPHSTSHIR